MATYDVTERLSKHHAVLKIPTIYLQLVDEILWYLPVAAVIFTIFF